MVKAVPLTCTGHSRPVTHLTFCNTAPPYLLVSGCKDGNPIVRHSVTGDWIGTFLGHKGSISAVRVSSDGLYCISSSTDFTAKIWSTRTGELVADIEHESVVKAGDFSPSVSNVMLIVTCTNNKVFIWRVDGSNVEKMREWQVDNIRSVRWLTNAIIVASDKKLTWFDISGEIFNEVNTDKSLLGHIEITGDQLLYPDGGNHITTYDINNGSLSKKLQLDYPVSAFAISESRDLVVTGTPDDTWVRLHEWNSGKLVDIMKGHHGVVHTVQFSSDFSIVATGSEDGTVRLWKVVDGPYGLWNTWS